MIEIVPNVKKPKRNNGQLKGFLTGDIIRSQDGQYFIAPLLLMTKDLEIRLSEFEFPGRFSSVLCIV